MEVEKLWGSMDVFLVSTRRCEYSVTDRTDSRRIKR